MTNLLDNEMVYCPLCNNNKPMKQITYKHLTRHSLTIQEFKIQYKQYHLIHPLLESKIKETRLKGKRKKENVIIEKSCWNFENCNNKVPVNINVGNKNVTCKDCRSKNLFHPDVLKQKERLSKQAKKLNKDPEIIKKRTNSLNNRTPEEIEAFKNKREETLVKKDGENWKQKQHEKTKAGMLRNHGVEYAFEIRDFLEQAQNTNFIKTGFINAMHDPKNVELVFSKRNQEEITEKTIKTNIRKYNGPGPMCHPDTVEKAKRTRFLNQKDRVLLYLFEVGFKLIGNYTHAHDKTIFKHTGGCGYEWKTSWNQLWNSSRLGSPCPNCKPKNINNKIAQNNLQAFIESLGFDPLVDNRIFLGDGRELDFIIEEEKVAIEYCGLYWHSNEVLKDTRKKINDSRTYHLTKLEICENKGYRLITIFEDEWIEKKDISKARLKQILNKSDSIRVHARKCEIREITTEAKSQFLKLFHIQGPYDGASIYYGAFNKDNNLIAIMTFGKPRDNKNQPNQWEIKRFCSDSNFHSPGIASKLLSHFQNNHEWSSIISYADRRWSDGNLYNQLGFSLENKGYPAPWFVDVNKVKRYHRSKMWKTNEDKVTGLTQEQLAVIKGYKIIYDCGSLKYVLNK